MESTHSAADLQRLAREVLEAAGAPPASAALVAGSLVESNLRGHDSHGVLRLTRYVQFIGEQRLDPTAEPEVITRRAAVCTVDGRNGFGQVAARRAVVALAATKPASGFDAVLVPGEIEQLARAQRGRDGVPVPAATWADLQGLRG